MSNKWVTAAIAAVSFCLAGCATEAPKKLAPPVRINQDPYPSTYHRYPGAVTAIRGATVFDGEGGRIDNGTVVFADGVVQAVGGPDTPIPAGAYQIDGARQVGDARHHRHPQPSRRLSRRPVEAHSDGNEVTGPITARGLGRA